jgi:hypothetical protein
MKALADIIGERDRFGVAEDLDGFAGGVDDQAAIGTSAQMLFEVDSYARVEDPVEIAR